MAFKIGLLGYGTVGTGTAEIILAPEGRNSLLQEIEIAKVGVRSLAQPRSPQLPTGILTTDLVTIVNDPEIEIVVELLGGLEPARSLILQAIANGKHIVTANKAVIARHGEEIFTAANQAGVYVFFEAAVGGGIPVIKPLKQSLGVNRIETVIGIINGTTNYILTQMTEEGADFEEVLAEAQQLGYAEADPTADVDGYDAADKIAILAAIAFNGRIKRDQISCEGIRQINATDISYADDLGFVIKLLAIAKANVDNDSLQVRVHPTLVPKDHPLANVNGVYNAILVEGDPLGQVMLFGPGAGKGATASAVVSDIVNIIGFLQTSNTKGKLDPMLKCSHDHFKQLTPIAEINTRFYARFLCRDVPGVIGHLGTSFGNHDVSLESVVQIGFCDDLAEIVVVTHDVQEGNFRQALEEIKSLASIDSIPSILRVL
ncbi:homoserine dehydrogenase [Pleurocapsa sp. CCALA 161]|uniref:homoserine dehydrogenase n=1 Tax=Pleurocapsa sp. CCALA 161 TaxID=2107688 RepID=UPI000D054F2C|nr:homoserine dehydrogenase [Pleurocapsa sp. CCALA 161]PSB09244.1 homoserine dehydrogenase [Pleurocapsa sp. CCALA 161]